MQLAGLSLRAYPASEDFVGALAGDSQEIGDYLASEVLDRVAPQERRFLLQTSILDRMSGALCDAVIGADGSAAQLADLDRRNLFVVALDSRRRWYRYHPPVRRAAALTAGRRGAGDGGRRCTVARPRGSPATARSPRPSATRSPPATSAPRPSSSRATG